MANYTKNGLLFILIGLIIGVISSVLIGLFNLFFSIQEATDLAGLVGFGIIGGIGSLFIFIGAILFFIGRKEFGKKHQRYVLYAAVLYIMGIILSGLISGLGTFLSMSESISGTIQINASWAGYAFIASSIIGAIFVGLAYIFALYKLESKTGRLILYLAFIVSIIITSFSGYLSMETFTEFIGSVPLDETTMDIEQILSFVSTITTYSTLGFISNILYIIAVYIPYKRIKNRKILPRDTIKKSPPEHARRICPNCKRTIPEDSNVCPYCGKKFESYI